MTDVTKIFLAGFASQMFVIYALRLIENPWMQIFAALFINIVAFVIFILIRVKK